jgi:hypothetical protein
VWPVGLRIAGHRWHVWIGRLARGQNWLVVHAGTTVQPLMESPDDASPNTDEELFSDPGSSAESTTSESPAELPKAPAFLTKLWQIVGESSSIVWDDGGTTFTIQSPQELEKAVLPRFFRGAKFSSFQRQLNYFGFRKVARHGFSYSHHLFQRGKPHMLAQIKRKPNTGNQKKSERRKQKVDVIISPMLCGRPSLVMGIADVNPDDPSTFSAAQSLAMLMLGEWIMVCHFDR